MKKRLIIVSICIILMLSLPFISAGKGITLPQPQANDVSSRSEPEKEESEKPKHTEGLTFRIKDSSSGNISEIPDREFCIGALAYEMSPAFEEQALCAQAVALYTHFSRIRSAARSDGQPYDLTADTEAGQYYYSREQLKEKWGRAYKSGIKKFEAAVDEVFGITLKNESGELIDAAYFALSSGMTEDAKDIFGRSDPDLCPVPVPWDRLSPDQFSEKRFSRNEYSDIISPLGGDGDDMTFRRLRRTSSGAVKSVILGGKKLTGAQVRSAFGLRSADFDISVTDGEIVFNVCGYGHGVGMSQNGANEMAKQGADWSEITSYFYHIKATGQKKADTVTKNSLKPA